MKIAKKLITFLGLTLLTSFISGCQKNKTYNIKFVDDIDICLLGEEYDFEPFFEQEKGFSYSMYVYYDDYGNDVPVEKTGDFTFIQNVYSDVFVEITGKKNNLEIKGTKVVTVASSPDDIDNWMYNCHPMEEGIIEKTLNYDKTYIRGNDSRSSLKISFDDFVHKFNKNRPCSFLNLIDYESNERFDLLRNDEGWDNAVLTMDIFNPNLETITIVPNVLFQKDLHSYLSNDISYNYYNALLDMKIRVPSESWVHYDLSLRSLGIVEHFVFNPKNSWDGSDRLYLQVTSEGYADNFTHFDFSFYIDNINITKYSKDRYPDLNTNITDEYLDAFTNDENITANITGVGALKKDEILTKDKTAATSSSYAIKIPLTGIEAVGSGSVGHIASFISGSFVNWKILDITNAIINFKVYFENVDTRLVFNFDSDFNVFTEYKQFDVLNEDGSINESTQGISAIKMDNGWYDITIQCNEVKDVFTTLVPASFIRLFRIHFFNKTTDTSKPSNIYFDCLNVSNWQETPYPLTEEGNPYLDTISPFAIERPCLDYQSAPNVMSLSKNDWTNTYLSRGDHTNVEYVTDVTSSNSFTSLHLSNHSGSWQFTHLVLAYLNRGSDGNWAGADLTKRDIVFDIKTINYDVTRNIGISIWNKQPSSGAKSDAELFFKPAVGYSACGVSVIELENGWLQVRISPTLWYTCSDHVWQMSIGTCSANSTDIDNCEIYIDNLHFEECGSEGKDLINTRISSAGNQHSHALDDGTIVDFTPVTYNEEVTYGQDSVRSAMLTIRKDLPSNYQSDPFGILDIKLAAFDKDEAGYNLSGKKLTFDYKVENMRSNFFELDVRTSSGNKAIYPPCGAEYNSNGVKIIALGNGWFNVTIDLSNSYYSSLDTSKIHTIRLAPRSNTVGEQDAYLYVDNMEVVDNA